MKKEEKASSTEKEISDETKETQDVEHDSEDGSEKKAENNNMDLIF